MPCLVFVRERNIEASMKFELVGLGLGFKTRAWSGDILFGRSSDILDETDSRTKYTNQSRTRNEKCNRTNRE